MARSTILLTGLSHFGNAALDENSMLQMPVMARTMQADTLDADCACPGYFKDDCLTNAFQGCMWTDDGDSNAPWCQCDPSFVPAPPLYTNQAPEPEPVVCCTASTATCGSCAAGVTITEYCQAHPNTEGCIHSNYIGCYIDDGSRDLQEGPMAYGYTTDTCAVACANYNFFALQNGGWCVCGNAYSTESQYALADADSQCGAPCEGESSGRCGGGWRNAVYNVNTEPAECCTDNTATCQACLAGVPVTQYCQSNPTTEGCIHSNYIGCYIDDGSRDLQEGPMAYGYTTDTCAVACANYNFFALQNGGWCVCGNAYSTESQYALADADSQCGAPCEGESSGRCGGGWRNAVYNVI